MYDMIPYIRGDESIDDDRLNNKDVEPGWRIGKSLRKATQLLNNWIDLERSMLSTERFYGNNFCATTRTL